MTEWLGTALLKKFKKDSAYCQQQTNICHLPVFLFSSVQFSHSALSPLCDSMDCSMPGLPVHYQLPKFTQTHVHWVGDAIQPSHSLSSPSLPALNLPQHQGLFQWVSSSHQVAKVWQFQLQHQSLQWILRTDFLNIRFNLLAVQGTLKSLLQHHSSKASIFQCSAFIIVQLSNPYMTTGKTIALTGQTFVGKINWFIWKDPDAGKDWVQEEKGMTEDEMVGWHHQLNQWTKLE